VGRYYFEQYNNIEFVFSEGDVTDGTGNFYYNERTDNNHHHKHVMRYYDETMGHYSLTYLNNGDNSMAEFNSDFWNTYSF
jgi:hypothetical protein